MSKVLYHRREFLEPYRTEETAYVYAYIEDYYKAKRAGKAVTRTRYDRTAEFGLHDGNDTMHLHFEWRSGGKASRNDIRKLRKLADVAEELAGKLEKL